MEGWGGRRRLSQASQLGPCCSPNHGLPLFPPGSYWDSAYDDDVMEQRVGLNLLYAQVKVSLSWGVGRGGMEWSSTRFPKEGSHHLLFLQTVADIERGWILANKEQHRQLKSLQEKVSKKEVGRGRREGLAACLEHPFSNPLQPVCLFCCSSFAWHRH